MRKVFVLSFVLTAALVGCATEAEKEREGEGSGKEAQACTSTPTPIASPTALPSTFPNPVSVTYTSAETLGPTQVINGYTLTEFADAFEEYKDAMGTGGYSVTKEEKEEDDAEVNFAGNGTTGQVKLEVDCKDRTSVRVTVRPA
ncbi:MAG: hypothetical protein WAT66_08130 [Actinomycetota bacterium]